MNNSIGIFDSGLGGTTIWRELNELLPNESTIYLSDNKNAPYGKKSKQEILNLSIKNVELLIKNDCKLIVVACNTATTNAIKELREIYNLPFVGIEPAIKPAALQTKTKSIGILATKGTLASDLFVSKSELYSSKINVIEQVGDGLVELIEQGEIYTDVMMNLMLKYLKPMIEQNIDHLVLGCTHYPYLIPVIEKIIPKHVKIIDSGFAVAKHTKSLLEKLNLLNVEKLQTNHQFYCNDKIDAMQSFLKEHKVNQLKF